MRRFPIRHKSHIALVSLACLAVLPLATLGVTALAGQATDSLSVARRVVAAAALAAKEYRNGVVPAGGKVTAPEEVDEAAQFLEQASLDAPDLPARLRVPAGNALTALAAMLKRAAPPDSVQLAANALGDAIAAAFGGKLERIPTTPPSLTRGRAVYEQQCTPCHGLAGKRQGTKARHLKGPHPADLTDAQAMSQLAPLDIFRKVTIGVAGTAMPEFEDQLSEDDRWAVTAYVATLQYGGSPTAATFAAVRRELDTAVAHHDGKQVFDAYLTFEQVETDLRVRDPGLTSDIEDRFGRLRTRATPAASPADLAPLHQELLADLERAERRLTDKNPGANLLVQSFFLLLREGFEAILIVAGLMAFLAKAGAHERRREVAWGAWLAVAASAVTAALIQALFAEAPGQRERLEGWTMLLATVVLFWVSYWLLSKVEADRWNKFVKGKLQDALSSGSGLALSGVAFLAVYREGFETILFYKALVTSGGTGGAPSVFVGFALAVVALVVIYLGINRFGMRVPMKLFFGVTGAMLYYMAFVFAGKGIAELQEAGTVGMRVIEGAPRLPLFGIYPTVESLAVQGLLVVAAIVALVTWRAQAAAARS